MPNDVFDFLWEVPKDGYRWIMASTYVDGDGKPSESITQSSHLEAEAQWVLTDGLGIGDRYERSRYAPLKSFPALFLAFAELLTKTGMSYSNLRTSMGCSVFSAAKSRRRVRSADAAICVLRNVGQMGA